MISDDDSASRRLMKGLVILSGLSFGFVAGRRRGGCGVSIISDPFLVVLGAWAWRCYDTSLDTVVMFYT